MIVIVGVGRSVIPGKAEGLGILTSLLVSGIQGPENSAHSPWIPFPPPVAAPGMTDNFREAPSC